VDDRDEDAMADTDRYIYFPSLVPSSSSFARLTCQMPLVSVRHAGPAYVGCQFTHRKFQGLQSTAGNLPCPSER
jgi:hypothetical protein